MTYTLTPRDQFISFIDKNIPMNERRIELVELFDKTVAQHVSYKLDRKHFSGLITAAMISSPITTTIDDKLVGIAILTADKLLEALEKS